MSRQEFLRRGRRPRAFVPAPRHRRFQALSEWLLAEILPTRRIADPEPNYPARRQQGKPRNSPRLRPHKRAGNRPEAVRGKAAIWRREAEVPEAPGHPTTFYCQAGRLHSRVRPQAQIAFRDLLT